MNWGIHTRRSRRLALGAAALAVVAVTGCAPALLTDTPSPSSPPASTPATSPAATPSAPVESPGQTSPTPTTSGAPAGSTPPASPTSAATTATAPTTPSVDGDSGFVAGTNHNAAAAAYAFPAEDVQAWLTGDAEPTEKIVFLTFDDGPNHKVTPLVLDALKASGVHATFFLVGNAIDGAPDMARRAVAEGNSLAIHSWSHDYKKLYPGHSGNTDRIVDEHDRTADKLEEVMGPDFHAGVWRYPGGHMSWKGLKGADAALADRGVHWIDWNAMTGDAEPKSRRPTTVAAMVTMATKPITDDYEVVVMLAHDSPGKDLTVQSLPQIIQAYQAAGYTFGIIA